MQTPAPPQWKVEDFDGDSRYIVSKLLIQASPETVWSILTDYERVTQVFSNVKTLKILSGSDCLKVMEHKVQPLPPVPPIYYVVEVRETFPTLLEWRGMTSYIKVNQGCFTLQPIEAGLSTNVTFAVWAEAKLLVPKAIIRYQLQKIMPDVLKTLKTHAEKRLKAGS